MLVPVQKVKNSNNLSINLSNNLSNNASNKYIVYHQCQIYHVLIQIAMILIIHIAPMYVFNIPNEENMALPFISGFDLSITSNNITIQIGMQIILNLIAMIILEICTIQM